MLRQRGLPASGSKAALVDRLLDSPQESGGVLAKLMEKWFMKPFTSSSMELGSVNEPNVRKALTDFFQEHGEGINLLGVAERGLLRKRSDQQNSQMMATSIDGLLVLHSETEAQPYVCALEIKTMTINNTAQEANDRLRRACGMTKTYLSVFCCCT